MSTRKLAGVALALAALLLVAAPMVFAQSGTTTSTVTTTQSTVTPAVTVNDQAIVNGTVTVASAVSDGPGWIVIHADANGAPGADLGHAALTSGTNTNVVVNIDVTKATPVLWAMLHKDAGTVGTYEFPGADIPVTLNGQIVQKSFNVTGGLASATGTVTATAAVSPTATSAVTATTAVSPTATTAVTATATSAVTATATTAVSPTATTAVVGAAGTATPSRLPTTGGTPVPWSLVVLGLGGLIMIGGLGLALARRS